MSVTLAGFPTLLLVLSLNILFMIRQRHIEIKRLIPLIKPQPDERMLPSPILDLKHEIPGRIEHSLDRILPLAGMNKARREKITGVRIFQPDLTSVLTRHHPQPTGPDLVGLQPFAAFVAAGGGARRDFVHGDLADD